ncbi:MAG: leucyl aminopeptidase family protein [Rhodospirillales bacterium]|nr:leucyl aminopeptidase family protein [Rhodospirillales bacterium]
MLDALRFLDAPSGLNEKASLELPLYAVRPEDLRHCLSKLPKSAEGRASLVGFTGEAGQTLLFPNEDGALAGGVIGLGNGSVFNGFGNAAAALPSEHSWRIEHDKNSLEAAELGFLLGAYRYQTLRAKKITLSSLGNASMRIRIVAGCIMFARELINTPANLMGPRELANIALQLASRFGAESECIENEQLAARYPAIQAVGAGSSRPPAVVIFKWNGSTANQKSPLISLCGKGVCFDTGGYNLKPGAAMRLMRKDMGGAAIALGLAAAIMALDLPIHLELRIGCAENSISGSAMRPSDVLSTRAGVTVEVGDTDAEGRLILCDLLNEACEAKPDWLFDIATLTGAARVALGPDLPALFCNNDALADTILASGCVTDDQLWRMPLHSGYVTWLDSSFADISNISSKPFGGAITAALFLQHFVSKQIPWAHIDTYAWNDSTRPGKPEGGEAQALQALLRSIEHLTSTQIC